MTLGISTNTRLLGIAVLENDELIDYRIYRHTSPWSPDKATRILASLEPCVRRYSIKSIVLSTPYVHHQTPAWHMLATRLKALCSDLALSMHQTSVAALYSFCTTDAKKTKKAAMQGLTNIYPELLYCYHKEMRNKHKYYIKIFEAVAAALRFSAQE